MKRKYIVSIIGIVLDPQSETDNYMIMDVTETVLTIKAFVSDGTLIDSVVLTK